MLHRTTLLSFSFFSSPPRGLANVACLFPLFGRKRVARLIKSDGSNTSHEKNVSSYSETRRIKKSTHVQQYSQYILLLLQCIWLLRVGLYSTVSDPSPAEFTRLFLFWHTSAKHQSLYTWTRTREKKMLKEYKDNTKTLFFHFFLCLFRMYVRRKKPINTTRKKKASTAVHTHTRLRH